MSVSMRYALLALLGVSAGVACREPPPPVADAARSVGEDLYAVAVPDAQRVVAVGYRGAIYTSADGGESWWTAPAPTQRSLYAVSLADSRSGWAVGQQGVILRTRDGGLHWTLQPNPKAAERTHLFGVHALDAERAVAVGAWGARIRTRDGGRTWTDHSLDVGPAHPQFVWLSEAEQAAVRRGRRVYEDTVLQDVTCLDGSSDTLGGRADTPAADTCWTVGEFGSVYRSGDGGVTWSAAEIRGAPPDPVLFGVSFDDASHGLVAGLGGLVLHSADGGRRWAAVRAGPARALFAVAAGPDRAVVVGEWGAQVSADRGASWSPPAEGPLARPGGFLRDVAFAAEAPRSTGFAVGETGRVLRTRDGGATWSRVGPSEPPAGRRSPPLAWVESRDAFSSRQLDRPMP